MNSMIFLHNRSHSTSALMERRAPAFDDAHAIKRKELERWENEGGRIPELRVRNNRDDRARRKFDRLF